MDTIKYCPQYRKNKDLNSYERGQVALPLGDGLSSYAIANKINRSQYDPPLKSFAVLSLKLRTVKRFASTSPILLSTTIWITANSAVPNLNFSPILCWLTMLCLNSDTAISLLMLFWGKQPLQTCSLNYLLCRLKLSIITSIEGCCLLKASTCRSK